MSTALAPSVTTRDSKGLKFISVVEGAYNKAALSDQEAQRVNDTPGLSDLVTMFIAEHRASNEFRDEEVLSKYGYISGYRKPAGLAEQCNQLRVWFPRIGYANQDLLAQIEKREAKLPNHAEGWFAIPNWTKRPEIFGSTYSQAVQAVLDTIKKNRNGKFYNYREGQIDEQHLQQSDYAGKFWQDLTEAQGNPDILIIAGQFGIRHRGRSVRRARVVIECTAGEFGLGAFAIGVMILAHPIRLQHCDDLWIDCAGDEFSDEADGQSLQAPYFGFLDGHVEFDACDVGRADGDYGSASGLFPQ